MEKNANNKLENKFLIDFPLQFKYAYEHIKGIL